jgi:hypothetical protein
MIRIFRETSARRFFDIAEALCRAVGNAIRPGFIQVAMAILVVRRIHRVRGVLLALEARFLAGGILPGCRSAADVTARVRRSGASGPAECADVRLPRRFAWLCGLVPGEAACFAGQLRVVLAEPGMVALLASCPQAVRVVQPLCRMLGIARTDYVPDERAPPPDDDAIRVAPIAPLEAAVANVPSPAEVMMGTGWTRFIPG